VAEELERRLGRLGSEELRAIALRKLEGYTTEEIAEQLDCARRTVERRLRLIRLQWTEEEEP
jgi:DNA-directed RNA polymerase specialized sigma24 family protein